MHGADRSRVGDITGDGSGDIIESHPTAGAAGEIRVYTGGERPAGEPIVITQATPGVDGSDQAGDGFGTSVAVGVLNGDKFADLVVGAPGEDSERGRVTIVYGGPDGHGSADVPGYGGDQQPPDVPFPIAPESEFGTFVRLRDVNGDGTLDLVATAPGNGYVVTMPGADGKFTKKGAQTLRLPEGVNDITLGSGAP